MHGDGVTRRIRLKIDIKEFSALHQDAECTWLGQWLGRAHIDCVISSLRD